MKALFGILLVAAGGSAYAQAEALRDLPIQFFYLKNTDPTESSALSGECDRGQRAPEITCRFTQVMIRLAVDPSKVGEMTQNLLSQFREEVKKVGFKKVADDLCADFKARGPAFLRDVKKKKAEKAAAEISEFLKLCEQPTVSSVEDYLRKSTAARAKKCNVTVFQNKPITYRRISATKWVSNEGPSGLCSAVYLYTLERDEKHDSLWTWTQTRTYADTKSEFCKDLQVGKKIEFSHEGFEPQLSCERVGFGLF